MAVSAGSAAAVPTLPQLWRQRCREWGDRPALRHKRHGIWRSTSWAEYFEQARSAGLALRTLGLQRGEVVSILSANRPEWLVVEMGAQAMGLVGHGLAPTDTAEEVGRQLAASGSRLVVVEHEAQLRKVLAVRAACPRLAHIVVVEVDGALRGFSDPMVTSYERLVEQGRAAGAAGGPEFDAAIDANSLDQTALLIYSSGTTGQPKAVAITQRGLAHQIDWAPALTGLQSGEHSLSLLPLANVFERVSTLVHPLATGHIVHLPENGSTVLNDLREAQPQFLLAQPRWWRKLHDVVEGFMAGAMPLAQRVYRGAMQDTAGSWQRRLALPNVRRYIGLDRLRRGVTTAAPLAPQLAGWYRTLGVELCEGYGSAELGGLCALASGSPPADGRTLRTMPGVEIRGDETGELLFRGAFVGAAGTPGSDVPAPAGWLRSGDRGRVQADAGIVLDGRWSDDALRADGPGPAQERAAVLLEASPFLTHALVLDAAADEIRCLLVLAGDMVSKHARDRHLAFADFAGLSRHPEIVELMRGLLQSVNAQLEPHERVHAFHILERTFGPDDEELTPVFELRRRVVLAKYPLPEASAHRVDAGAVRRAA